MVKKIQNRVSKCLGHSRFSKPLSLLMAFIVMVNFVFAGGLGNQILNDGTFDEGLGGYNFKSWYNADIGDAGVLEIVSGQAVYTTNGKRTKNEIALQQNFVDIDTAIYYLTFDAMADVEGDLFVEFKEIYGSYTYQAVKVLDADGNIMDAQWDIPISTEMKTYRLVFQVTTSYGANQFSIGVGNFETVTFDNIVMRKSTEVFNDGTFDEGLGGYNFKSWYNANEGDAGVLEIVAGEAVYTTNGKRTKNEIALQQNFVNVDTARYLLSFDAKGDVEGDLFVEFKEIYGSYTYQAMKVLDISGNTIDAKWDIPITTEMTTYQLVFDVVTSYGANQFSVGVGNFETVTFDNMSMIATDQDYIVAEVLAIGDDLVKNTISVYPNPVSNRLFIGSPEAVSKAVMYNLSGTKLFESNSVFDGVDVSTLHKGIYHLKITNNDGQVSMSKFIKE